MKRETRCERNDAGTIYRLDLKDNAEESVDAVTGGGKLE